MRGFFWKDRKWAIDLPENEYLDRPLGTRLVYLDGTTTILMVVKWLEGSPAIPNVNEAVEFYHETVEPESTRRHAQTLKALTAVEIPPDHSATFVFGEGTYKVWFYGFNLQGRYVVLPDNRLVYLRKVTRKAASFRVAQIVGVNVDTNGQDQLIHSMNPLRAEQVGA